jgi:hypothetical protein
VRLRPKYFVYGLLALDGFGLLFYELLGSPAPFAYSPSAHLGGMLVGWVYARFLHANNGWDRPAALPLRWPQRLSRRRKEARAAAAPPARRRKPTPALRAEVDRILDKINSEGFGALTAEEKRLLDEAKDLLSKH